MSSITTIGVDKTLSYEIHVTGDESIIENANKLGWKTIEIDLLKPDGSVLRREYMTSEIRKYKSLTNAFDDLILLTSNLHIMGTTVIRSKIEAPPYPYLSPLAFYLESHFETNSNEYPISRNSKKTKILATDREYNPDNFNAFIEKYKGRELEICLYDSDVNEDKDWFNLWEK